MMQERERELVRVSSQSSIEKYKKKLLAQVVSIFLICLIVILQRVFYQIIVDAEEGVLASLQLKTNMTAKTHGVTTPKDIGNSVLRFLAELSAFQVQFLLVTHVLITLYVSFNAYLATKLTYLTLGVIYFISVLQMFYAGPRPFWSTDAILSSGCLSSYNHPSLGLILMMFVPGYGYFCWNRRSNNSLRGSNLSRAIIGVLLFVIVGTIQFINYFSGMMYLINIGMSLIMGTLLLMVAINADNLIQNTIKKSTILKTDSKKYVFYWLLFICLLCTFVSIVFSGQDLFLEIDWVQNYMSCTRYLKYPFRNYRFDQIVGPWFNFVQTTVLFAWIGAVFGVSGCFRKMPTIDWAEGSVPNRIIRAVIANAFIIPSWLLILLLQDKGTWIKDIGLNVFILNSVHFFLLYFWLMGYMPILIFRKLLKIANEDPADSYIILEEKLEK